MATALKEATTDMARDTLRITKMRDMLIKGLSRTPYLTLNGSMTNRLPGNVNISFEGIEGESLLLMLDNKGICASAGSACNSGSLDPSHVLTAIGVIPEIARGSIRFSLSAENTFEEVEYVIRVVTDCVKYLRSVSPIY